MVFWQLIIIQVVTFALLIFLLRQFLYQQVTRSQDKLQQLVQQNRKREEELNKRREETEKELEIKIGQHNEEVKKLRAAAEVDAQKMQEEIVARAKEDAKRIVTEEKEKREQVRAKLVAEMEEKALDLASDIIGHIFTAQVVRGIHYQLTDEFIEEIGKSDGRGLQLDVETVEVAVPYSLTEVQMEKLKKILSSKMDRSIEVTQTIDQSIVTGMVVKLGDSVLDGSLNNKLKGAMAYVRGSLSR